MPSQYGSSETNTPHKNISSWAKIRFYSLELLSHLKRLRKGALSGESALGSCGHLRKIRAASPSLRRDLGDASGEDTVPPSDYLDPLVPILVLSQERQKGKLVGQSAAPTVEVVFSHLLPSPDSPHSHPFWAASVSVLVA